MERNTKMLLVEDDASLGYLMADFLIDYFNQSLYFQGSCRRLTGKENEVIALLIINSGQIVRKETILKSIWGTNDYFSGRSLDVYISKLRKYLQADPNVLIENISKVGFILQVKSELEGKRYEL